MSMARTTLPATASATAVLVAGIPLVALHNLGPLSGHMAMHLALMNVVAPFCVALLTSRVVSDARSDGTLWFACALQIGLLWALHTPSVQHETMESSILQVTMQATLFVAAFLFWNAVSRLTETARWQSVPALLLTGKLSCLLAALLVFSPRSLYVLPEHADAAIVPSMASLEDQQLAGLMMIIACPLSYLSAGVVVAAQLIGLGQTAGKHRPRPLSTAQ
jgi:putative membrane protein